MESDIRKSPETLAVLVVGTDTLIEALPARPIQLAHACGELGFDLVIPLSWGDELVAEAALRDLEAGPPSQAVLCSCPLVRRRLLQAGADLAAAMVSLVSPPVAVARHLRASLGERIGSLTFVGSCPDARNPEFDVTYDSGSFIQILRDRGIGLETLPDTFVDRLPPDRRRHVSLPGGCPSPEMLWQRCHEMSLAEVEGPDLALEIAQRLFQPQRTLVDVAAAVGCHCCGITDKNTGTSARVAVMSLEPPRSVTPVITDAILPDLSLAVVTGENGSVSQLRAAARPPMAVTPPTALATRK